jgi:hypothetical protein
LGNKVAPKSLILGDCIPNGKWFGRWLKICPIKIKRK